MRLFAIDLDGTCINSRQQITDRTLGALRRASEAGIEVVPTTGRTRSCLPEELRKEPYIRYLITSNGARVTDTKTGKTVYQAPVPTEEAMSLLAEGTQQKLGVTAHIDDESYVQGRLLNWIGHRIYRESAANTLCVKDIRASVDGTRAAFDELQFFLFTKGAMQRARKLLSGYDLTATFGPQYVEVFSKEANKGRALSVLAGHLGIPQAEVACIGDGENDVFMFAASGLTFAMGNAVDSLKARADHVVSTNDLDGVAEAIENYLIL